MTNKFQYEFAKEVIKLLPGRHSHASGRFDVIHVWPDDLTYPDSEYNFWLYQNAGTFYVDFINGTMPFDIDEPDFSPKKVADFLIEIMKHHQPASADEIDG